MPLYEVNPQPWSMQQIYSESYVLRLEKRIAELEEALKIAIEIANYEEVPKRKVVDGWSDLIQFPNKERNAP